MEEGSLKLIKGTRSCSVPSHSFYAGDLMIFCKGNIPGLKDLKDLFDRYALASGQIINNGKSTIFFASITPARLNHIVSILNFNIGSMPFNYLAVPIFKGKPKPCHLQPIVDRIKLKLSNWKASLLTMAGRVQLLQSVIQSMFTYCISVYVWPIFLLKDLEKAMRNFIWSGDKDKGKLIYVSWKKVCRPYAQGGLNLRSFISLNQATNLKFCWNMLKSKNPWVILLKDKVLRNKKNY